MAKYNRKCVLCGKTYEYCNTCASYQNKPIWSFSYCSEDCKDIVGILTDFIFNRLSKEDAKIALEDKDSSRHMNYKGGYYKAFKDIMSNEEKSDIKEKTESIVNDVKTSIAQDTAAAVKKNIMSETNKVYPKAIAHKHGK